MSKWQCWMCGLTTKDFTTLKKHLTKEHDTDMSWVTEVDALYWRIEK